MLFPKVIFISLEIKKVKINSQHNVHAFLERKRLVKRLHANEIGRSSNQNECTNSSAKLRIPAARERWYVQLRLQISNIYNCVVMEIQSTANVGWVIQ